jgi:hypothetical protein
VGVAISAKTTLLLVAALAFAPVAQAAEISEQPRDVRKGQIVQVGWAGDSSYGADAPAVVVERRHGLAWMTQASGEAAGLVVEELGGAWSARWQPSYGSPSGVHRIRVEGADYALTSDEFDVRPCVCVIPNQLRSEWRRGRFRLWVTAEYWPGPARGFLTLPRVVTTGRPVVRVFRDGRRIGSVLLRYRRGKFRGSWPGPRGPRNSVIFELVSLTDGFGNR